MTTPPLPPRLALAATLERQRLERQERRLRLVVAELRTRAAAHRGTTGAVQSPLGRAIADFDLQLRSVRARLGSSPSRPPKATSQH